MRQKDIGWQARLRSPGERFQSQLGSRLCGGAYPIVPKRRVRPWPVQTCLEELQNPCPTPFPEEFLPLQAPRRPGSKRRGSSPSHPLTRLGRKSNPKERTRGPTRRPREEIPPPIRKLYATTAFHIINANAVRLKVSSVISDNSENRNGLRRSSEQA